MCQPKFLPATPRAGASQYAEPGSKKRKAPPSPGLTGTSAGTGTGAAAGAGTSSRTRALTLEELQENFHLPINEVACKLGVCVTVLKQQCRELGIVRWPYRKVRKLDNMLVALESAGPSKARPFALSNGEEERQRKISTVKKTLRELIADPNSCAHLKLGKVKGLKADGEAAPPAEGAATAEAATPGSPKAEKATGFSATAPASTAREETAKDALTSFAGLLKGVSGAAGPKAKCESGSWLVRGDWEEEGAGSEGLAAGTPPMDDGLPMNRSSSGDGCDVMEAASALIWGRLRSNQAVKSQSAQDEGNNTFPSASANSNHAFSNEAAGTSFLSLLEGSLAAVPANKDEGAGAGEAETSRAAAVGAGHAQEEDEERPLSFSLGPPRPHSRLALSRNDGHGASKGWLSSYMPSSSSSSPDKGPCLGPHSRGAQAPAHSTAPPSAATTTNADPLPHGPAHDHLRPCDAESSPEGSPAGRMTDLRRGGRLWVSAGEEVAEGSGGAVELDLISRLEAGPGVPRTADVCAPNAPGASGRTQGRGGEAQQSPAVGAGSPSPRLPSSPLGAAPHDAAVAASAQEVEQERQKPQGLKVESGSELLPAAGLTMGGAGLPSLASEDLLPQPVLLLGGYDGLRGLRPQPVAPVKTISQPLAARMATVLPSSQLATVLPASQLATVNALLLGRQGLGLGAGGHMLPPQVDALSLSRQHLALLQRQQQAQQQAQLMRMLAGSPMQHASSFAHPSLAAMGQGSHSIVDVLMAQRAAHF